MTMLKAVILDWAGTVVDHGSRAPMGAFVRAFGQFGVTISIDDARGPMGMAKLDHIRAVGRAPAVAAAWRAKHGRDFSDADADAIFAVFEPMNVAAIKDHADFIPGALEALAAIRARGLRIGSTTGYTRPIMAELAPIAAAGGYEPDVTVCAGDGRPGRLAGRDGGEGRRHAARHRRGPQCRNMDRGPRADRQHRGIVGRGTGGASGQRAFGD
jgi:phosphonoacetaldehyde hydrolase